MNRKSIYALPLAGLLAAATALAEDKAGYGTGSGMSPSDRTVPERSSSAGAAVSDAAITAKVKSALLAEQDLASMQISVETNDGVVQLSGFLNSQNEIERAISIARNVADVKAVENNIQTGKASDMPTR